jgi:hypothetical protein
MILILLRKEKSSILFIVKRPQFVVNHIRSSFTMNGLEKPAVFSIAINDLIALALWIPRSPAGLTLTVTVRRTSSRKFSPPRQAAPFFPNEAMPRVRRLPARRAGSELGGTSREMQVSNPQIASAARNGA